MAEAVGQKLPLCSYSLVSGMGNPAWTKALHPLQHAQLLMCTSCPIPAVLGAFCLVLRPCFVVLYLGEKWLFVQTVHKAEEMKCRVGEMQWKLAWEFWILVHPAEAVGFT